ncbi:hypothetical protein [Oleidesulfovibrio sp.]|uniref:hypothetical protein n=1 Tax=Oleidesulfovibrio sp. TaxID=2909707 RepID=UPI003A8C43ED
MSNKRESLDMTPPPRRKGGVVILVVVVLLAAAAGYFLWQSGSSEPPQVGQNTPSGQMTMPVPSGSGGNSSDAAGSSGQAGAAGQTAAGQIGGLPDSNAQGNRTNNASGNMTDADSVAAAGAQQNSKDSVPAVTEDSIIGPAFITDIARWLVEGYYPRGTYPTALKEGVVVRDVKMLNTHAGIGMPGISWEGEDIRKGREAVLAYVLTPTMVRALYSLYEERFMASVEQQAGFLVRERKGREQPLTDAEKREMYSIYARLTRGVAAIADNVLDMPDAVARVKACLAARKATLDANGAFAEALYTYQSLLEQNASYAEVQAALKAKDAAGKAFQQAIVERERKIAALASALRRPGVSRALDEEGAVYVAMWIARRLEANPEAVPAIREGANVLRDVAAGFEARSR